MLSRKLTIEWFAEDKKILRGAEKVYVASALLSEWAFDFLYRNTPNRKEFKLLLGIHLPSDLNTLERILDLQNNGEIECRIYVESFFHPKLYIFEGENLKKTFIGSGNFTKGGLQKNIELFHRVDDSEHFHDYKTWFENHFKDGLMLTVERLNLIRSYFEKRRRIEHESQEEVKALSELMTGKFNLDHLNFEDQFFNKSNHITFSPENRNKEGDEAVNELRKETRHRLYELHDLIYPEINRKGWDLNPHYVTDDMVSQIEISFHRSNEISSLWLHYGRSKQEIKRYGEGETPLYFSRMQVIIHYDDVGVWLRFGKENGSRQDRGYFHSKMKNDEYRNEMFKLLKDLGPNYWLRIGDDEVFIEEINDSEDLWEFTKRDNWRTDYFIIGKSFSPDDKKLSIANIVETIITEFEKLYPVYIHMKDKSFVK